MGSLFKTPKNEQKSTLSSSQQALLDTLARYITPEIGQVPQGLDALRTALLGDTTEESYALSERIFREGLMGPALREFDQQVAPRINAGFSRIGGIQNSRRGNATADALTTLQTNAQGELARMLPTIRSFPLQQTLSQIQGLGAIENLKYLPYQQGLGLALQPTQQTVQRPAGAGWGLLGSAIQAGLIVGGGALAGPAGAADGAAVGKAALPAGATY